MKPGTRGNAVFNIIELINNRKNEFNPESCDDILLDLAFDLDNYEENPDWRRQSYSYFGDEKLEILINEAITKIETILQEKE